MPIENMVEAAELSATTDPVGDCMENLPARVALSGHYRSRMRDAATPRPAALALTP
jgi:hypothetical protein